MPRRPRIQLNVVPLHIVQRGHNREPNFFAEEDCTSYLHWLGEALGDTACQLHGYALMTNHVHLLLTPRKAELVPKLIMSLGRRYVQYIIRTYKHTDNRLTPHALYQALGRTDGSRQTAYRALFRTQLDWPAIDDIRLALNQNQPVGNSRFYDKIEKAPGVRREARKRGRPRLEVEPTKDIDAGQRVLAL